MYNQTEYEKFRNEARLWFKNTKSIHSPVLNKRVFLTSEGFEHIIYKRARAERDKATQIMRFKLLKRAISLIEISTTYQEFEELSKDITVKFKGEKVQVSKKVQYWGLIAIIENRKIKVIIRKVGNGEYHFWSVIPAWTTSKQRDLKFISTMKGDPNED